LFTYQMNPIGKFLIHDRTEAHCRFQFQHLRVTTWPACLIAFRRGSTITSIVVKHAVILAGGTGTRLWPASTRKNPKQFLRIGEGRSLFAMTLQRAIGLEIEGSICVVTHRDHVDGIVQECREVLEAERFPPARVLILAEPEARNTAPAIGYACTVLQDTGTVDDTLIVMPADHVIEPLSAFTSDVGKAAIPAEQGWLVTFGIPPDRPETGYGYIEAGEALGPGFRVRKFKEKPDAVTARSFLAQGNHYWNSGMFAFRAGRFLEELGRYAPKVARAFSGIPQRRSAQQSASAVSPVLLPADEGLQAAYGKCPSISIDYAVMEHSEHCAVIPAGFSWSDVGSWDVVAELSASNPRDAVDLFTVDATGNFVLSDLPVALVGVQDLLVVVRNGIVLVCRKGKTQQVKDIVQILKEKDRTDLL
jgi:mannose-1-phosphate guanylyltransferase/mannose-6-phosphate isomerase